MERLTKRDGHGNIELIGVDTDNMLTDCVNEAEANRFLKALNRLAEYEDTGLEPKELNEKMNEAYDLGAQSVLRDRGLTWSEAEELLRYREAEEQGLLVRLPCKVGDSFFAVRKFCDEYGELEEPVEHWDSDCYGCNLPCNGKLKVVERKFNSIHHIIANINSIGDSIFLTREEAEKALEEV